MSVTSMPHGMRSRILWSQVFSFSAIDSLYRRLEGGEHGFTLSARRRVLPVGLPRGLAYDRAAALLW
jgi:hypothetical protein